MRLAGGSASLIRAIMRDLPKERLQFGARVAAMRLTDQGVALSLQQADQRPEAIRANWVIAALPPRILDMTVQFEPRQEPETRRKWQDTPTWMAPHAKFFAIYDRPFWRDAGFSGTAQSMVGPLAEIHDATTASGLAALFGFVGLSARQRASIGEASLTKAGVEQFARLFGAEAAAPRATLYKDWADDPLTATPSDLDSAGHPQRADHAWVSGPWQPRLKLAGSETSASEPGYLAGAVEASSRAAAGVAKTLAGSPIGDHGTMAQG